MRTRNSKMEPQWKEDEAILARPRLDQIGRLSHRVND